MDSVVVVVHEQWQRPAGLGRARAPNTLKPTESTGRGYPPPMSAAKKRPIALVLVLSVLLGVPLGLWLLRGTIATSVARSELAVRGLSCDERFAVSLSATFDEAVIGPTRCTRDGGVTESFELLGDLTLELDGFTPTSARADSLRLTLRDLNVRGGDRWAPPLRRLDLEPRVAALMKGLSELSEVTANLPPMSASRVEVVRASAPLATLSALELTPGDALALSVERIHFGVSLGTLDLNDVRGTATASNVDLAGTARASAGIGILSVARGGAFTVEARGLDTADPHFDLDANF